MNPTERAAMDLAIQYELSQGRHPVDVSHGAAPGFLPSVMAWASARHPQAPSRPGCDLVSLGTDGVPARIIEVKGKNGDRTSVPIVERQRAAMNALGEDWWLYVALNCGSRPELIIVREPRRLPWHLLTEAAELPAGQYRRVGQEARWGVQPSDIRTFGEVALL
ncbi:DUF3883 domain-containing protein [Streptomyces sp. NPDC093801]|uniref:DUF3883 domain-containing protein n=1 Tax=Streptomyces sp. NPDC093801 TaxID=3155203 RepID=UPI00344B74F9